MPPALLRAQGEALRPRQTIRGFIEDGAKPVGGISGTRMVDARTAWNHSRDLGSLNRPRDGLLAITRRFPSSPKVAKAFVKFMADPANAALLRKGDTEAPLN
jgi:hypothetical protein